MESILILLAILLCFTYIVLFLERMQRRQDIRLREFTLRSNYATIDMSGQHKVIVAAMLDALNRKERKNKKLAVVEVIKKSGKKRKKKT